MISSCILFKRVLACRLCVLTLAISTLTLSWSALAGTSIMGTLEGHASVDQGGLSYHLDLDLPTGISGHKPALSLHYNPYGGNGAVGIGFNLNNPDTIARCQATERVDGYAGAIALDNNDDYCLNGQRLVPVSGIKGAANTRYVTSTNEHSRITSLGQHQSGPASWLVEHPNGDKLTFANDDTSVDKASGDAIVRWRVTEKADRHDNKIQYHYQKIQNRSQLSRLDYAHHQVTFVYTSRPDTLSLYQQGVAAPLTQRLSHVQVKTNNQAVYNYHFGYDTSNGFSRLSQVRRCDGSNQSTCQAPTVFSWQADANFDDEINDHNTGEDLLVSNTVDFTKPPKDFLTYQVADINRDGIRDLCYLDKKGLWCGLGSQGQPPSNFKLWNTNLKNSRWRKWGVFQSLSFLDLNGDRYPDLCIRDNKQLFCATNNRLSGKSGKFKQFKRWLNNAQPQGQYMDVNNDGKADWCQFEASGVNCFLSNGAGFRQKKTISSTNYHVTLAPEPPPEEPSPPIKRPVPIMVGDMTIFVFVDIDESDGDDGAGATRGDRATASARFMDANGDGLVDLCGFSDNGLRCQLNIGPDDNGLWQYSGSTKTYSTELTQTFMQRHGVADSVRMGDINGDGLQDLCLRDNLNIRCAVNQGNRLSDLDTWLSLPSTYTATSWHSSIDGENLSKNKSPHEDTLSLVDWNQDGRADLCVSQRDNEYQCALNRTTAYQQGFKPLTKVADLVGSAYEFPVEGSRDKQEEPLRHYPLRWSDINSDGAMDFCHRSPTGISCGLGSTLRYHRLTGITSGLGRQTNVAYGRLHDSDIYETRGVIYDNLRLVPYTPAMTVVKSIAQTNAEGGTNTTDYFYAGMYYDLDTKRRTPFKLVKAYERAYRRHESLFYHLSGHLRGKLDQHNTFVDRSDRRSSDASSMRSYFYDVITEQTNPLIKRIRINESAISHSGLRSNGEGLHSSVVKEYSNFNQYDQATQVQINSWLGRNLSHQKTIHTNYKHLTDTRWLLGLPTRTSTTVTGESQARVVTNDYDDKGNRVTQTIQPGHALASTTQQTFDSYGNVLTQTQSGSDTQRTDTFTYDSNGINQLSHTNALGHQQQWQYHATCDKPIRHTDANGLITTWDYDSLCRQTSEQHPQGSHLTWRYGMGQGGSVLGSQDLSVYYITQTQTDQPDVTTYYGALGHVLRTQTAGFNGRDIYQDTAYNARGLKAKSTVPYYAGTYAGAHARWTHFTYDGLQRITQVSRPGPNNTTLLTNTTYGRVSSDSFSGGLLTTVTDAEGISRQTKTNGLGQIVQVTEGNSTSTLTYQYDGWGQLSQSDANGTVITHQYDPLSNKIQTVDPSLGTWKFAYNAFGELTQQTDAKGQVTQFTYDDLGRMTQRVDDSGTSQWTYDQGAQAKGRLSQSNASGAMGTSQTQVTYNNQGLPNQVIKTIGSDAFTTTTTYDSIGRPSVIELPDGIRYENRYEHGQLIGIVMPKEQIWDYNFDLIEQGMTQATANIARLTAEMADKEAEEIRLANEARRLFDVANDWLAQGEDYQSQAETLRHHARQLQAKANYYQRQKAYWQSLSQYYVKTFGSHYFELVSQNGYYHFRYERDLGCVRRDLSGGCRARSNRDYNLNISSALASFFEATYTTKGIRPHQFYTNLANHYQRQSNNQLDEKSNKDQDATDIENQAHEASIAYANNRALAQAEIDNAKQYTEELEHYRQQLITEQQRLATLTAQQQAHDNGDDTTITVWRALNRDAAGRLTSQLYGNGLITQQAHDPFTGRLQSIKTGSDVNGTGALIRHLSYTYDANDNVSQRQDHINGLTETYHYDDMERVTRVQANVTVANKTYAYDSRGNMTQKSDAGTMTYSNNNRLTQLTHTDSQVTQYEYDANGNQIRGLGHTATWNAFNKTSHISQSGHTSAFYYDANQMRTQQVETRRDGSQRTTQYVSAHYERSVEESADGQTLVTGTHTLYAEGQAVSIHIRTTLDGADNADQFRYLHRDPLDSVDTITDGNGQVQERLSYDPFGQRRQANGQSLTDLTRNPSALTTRGYTNHEHLDQVQLIHMNARLYDPITARFLSADTLVPWPTYSQAHNRYIYVMNNPLKYNDPTGHAPDYGYGHKDSYHTGKRNSDDNGRSDSNHQNTIPVVVTNPFDYHSGLAGSWDAGVGIDTAPNNNGYSPSLAYQDAAYGAGRYGKKSRRDDVWNRKGMRGKVNRSIPKGSKYVGVYSYGNWVETVQAPTTVDTIPGGKAISAIKAFFQAVGAMLTPQEHSRTVHKGEFQKYEIYEYQSIYDLENGNRINENVIYGTKTFVEEAVKRTNTNIHQDKEYRMCHIFLDGC